MTTHYKTKVPQIGDVYIYMDRPMLALPISLTIIRVNKEFPELCNEFSYSYKFYLGGGSRALSSLNRLTPYIERLEEEEYITYQHRFIYPSELNKYGHHPYLRERHERELANFFWVNKLRVDDTKCYRINDVTKSYHYYNERIASNSIGLKTAFFLGWLRRRILIESVWHPLHPEYDWLTNNGTMVWPHIDVCIKKGIEPRYHINESLKKVPYHWYREILKGNAEEIYLNNYWRKPPYWWKKLVGQDFFCYLSTKQIDQVNPILEGRMRCEFAINFMDTYPPLFDSEWDDYKSIFRKRMSYANYLKKSVNPRIYT